MDQTNKKRKILRDVLSKVKGVAGAAFDKTKDVVGTAIALPKLIKEAKKSGEAKMDYTTLKNEQKYAGAPLYDDRGIYTKAYEAKFMADRVRDRRDPNWEWRKKRDQLREIGRRKRAEGTQSSI